MFCRDILEKPAITVSPYGSPAYLEAVLGQEAFDEGDIDGVEVDLTIAQTGVVFSPVMPEMFDNSTS